MSRVVFLDTETTGLDSRTEDVFEIAVVGPPGYDWAHVFRIEPRPGVVDRMHPKAAEVNRFHERTADPAWTWDAPGDVLHDLRILLDGVHICGAVPDFDTRFLTALFWRFGTEPPRWHYHLIDVEALAVGYLHGQSALASKVGAGVGSPLRIPLPWKSDALSRACGVEPPGDDERHTALGDARWAKRLYEAITEVSA